MSKINFLDVNDSFNTNRTIKNIENPLEDIDFSETIKNQSFHSNSKILHTHLLNSLNYQSQNNLFPSTLPKEINIKFTNTSFIDKFKSLFSKNELAEVNLNSNTIYISSHLLSNNPKDQFLQEFSHKFQDKQSLIDVSFIMNLLTLFLAICLKMYLMFILNYIIIIQKLTKKNLVMFLYIKS